MLEKIIKHFFDYDIVGEYYDHTDYGVLKKKYIKRYYLKCLRDRRKK